MAKCKLQTEFPDDAILNAELIGNNHEGMERVHKNTLNFSGIFQQFDCYYHLENFVSDCLIFTNNSYG